MESRDLAYELFPAQDWHLPAVRPDETLYSWCVRLHRLNLGQDPRDTSRMLFGHSHAALHHDIPFAIAQFVKRTQGWLGPPLQILRQRTIFGFHAKFLPAELEHQIGEIFAGSDNSVGRAKLGLKKVGHASGRLRFCPECLELQLREHGHTWWKLSHQLPTSVVCSKHHLALHTFPLEQYRGIARNFELPSMVDSLAMPPHIAEPARCRLAELTEWGLKISRIETLRLTDDTLRWCYRFQARHRGWVALDGSLRMQELRDRFVGHYGDALNYFDADMFGDLNGANGGFLAYLFRRAPSHRHPLKHVLLLNFLFESFEQFDEVCRDVRQTLDSDGPAGCEKRLLDSQATLLRLVQQDGQSLSKAAPTVGTSVTTAARFLDMLGGIQRDRRPHIAGTEKEVMLCTLLGLGTPRKEIAEKVGIRRSFIKDYLAQHSSLKSAWEEAYEAKEKEKHRAQLLSALAAYPGLPIKAIRRLPQNGFQWLYNNDREWLQEVLPAIWKR